eukprot:353851-Chlamydomonas_euryale.AAC.14
MVVRQGRICAGKWLDKMTYARNGMKRIQARKGLGKQDVNDSKHALAAKIIEWPRPARCNVVLPQRR